MKLDIGNFLQSPEYKLEFSGELQELNSCYSIVGLDLVFPIEYNGIIFDLDNELILDLYVNYKYNTECSRCLKPMIEIVKTDLKAHYFKNMEETIEDEASIDFFEIIDNQIDLEDLIVSQIITSIPFKNLCGEDCKGLCPNCGTNLNEKECSCNKELEIDPRLGKLMDLFNDEEV